MNTRWTQQREQGGSSITSLKNKLPSEAAKTKSQAANRIFQCRLGEGFASCISGEGSPKSPQIIDRRGATQECTSTPTWSPESVHLRATIRRSGEVHNKSMEPEVEARSTRLPRCTAPCECDETNVCIVWVSQRCCFLVRSRCVACKHDRRPNG